MPIYIYIICPKVLAFTTYHITPAKLKTLLLTLSTDVISTALRLA